MKNISIIVAKTLNNVIGKNNQMPWHLPADLKWFKEQTLNKTVIMGRKTFESIGKPLPNRRNIILSRTALSFPGVTTANSLEEAIKIANTKEEIMIIGGANVYEQALRNHKDKINKLYLSIIQVEIDGDAYFPELDFSLWQLVHQETLPSDQKNLHAVEFLIYKKI